MKSVLLIDDSQDYRETVSAILFDHDFDVVCASCPKEAFESLTREDQLPDLIVCDLHMPFSMEQDIVDYPYSYEVGIKTILEFRESFPEIPLIAITATAPHDLAAVTHRIQSIPTLSKPFHRSELLNTMAQIFAQGAVVEVH